MIFEIYVNSMGLVNRHIATWDTLGKARDHINRRVKNTALKNISDGKHIKLYNEASQSIYSIKECK